MTFPHLVALFVYLVEVLLHIRDAQVTKLAHKNGIYARLFFAQVGLDWRICI